MSGRLTPAVSNQAGIFQKIQRRRHDGLDRHLGGMQPEVEAFMVRIVGMRVIPYVCRALLEKARLPLLIRVKIRLHLLMLQVLWKKKKNYRKLLIS